MTNQTFESVNEWRIFITHILYRNRFIPNKDCSQFLNKLLFTAKKREKTYSKGDKFLRAQIGYEGDLADTLPYSRERMLAPDPGESTEGRANPRGISYLYLADGLETVIAEVRPFLTDHVTVATYELNRGVKCVDMSKDNLDSFLLIKELRDRKSLSASEIERLIWSKISIEFSIPTRHSDKSIGYIPSQYLAEFFKKNGYDGIIYKSSLNTTGHSIVLFNVGSAKPMIGQLYYVEGIKYEPKPVGSPRSYID